MIHHLTIQYNKRDGAPSFKSRIIDNSNSDNGAYIPTFQSIQQTLPLKSEIEKFIPKI